MTRPITALALALALALPGLAPAEETAAPSEMTAEAREALHSEIRAYLLENPEVILEAINVLEERRAAATEASDGSLIAENAAALFDDGFSWVGGNPDGDLTVVEFLDYRCGFCKRAHPVVDRLLEEDGNIRLIVKEFPILGPDSVMASRMALAALQIDPEGYEDLHAALMSHRGQLTEVAAYRIARETGYEVAELKARIDSDEISEQLADTYALGEALGLRGTPSFVIGDRIVRGFLDFEQMSEVVSEVRAAR